jgi:DNA-binding LacI/PurR family transcriptional regulator
MGGRLAAQHLVSRNPELLLCENSVFFKRTEGFVHEAARHGFEPVLYDMDSFDDSFKKALKKTGPRPVGVFACMDINAAEILRRVKETGVRVGSDVPLIGYDDLELCAFTEPALTTVRQNFLAEGERVVEKLVNMIYGGEERDESIPAELVVRESA